MWRNRGLCVTLETDSVTNMENIFITAEIVLLLAIVWRLWGWLDKRRKWKWNKIEPKPPWDGVHKLVQIKHYTHYGDTPQEHSAGYIWKCACGMGNAHNFWRLPPTEEASMTEFKKHMKAYQ